MIRVVRSAFLAALLVCLFAADSVAQDEVPVQMSVNYATFLYDEQASLLELYTAIDASSLEYEMQQGRYVQQLPLYLTLFRATDAELEGTPTSAVWADSLSLTLAVPDTTQLAPGQHFVNQFRAAVPPGEYQLRARIPSSDGRQSMELRSDVIVPDFQQEEPMLSDLTIASMIRQAQEGEERYVKNGLLIRPNASTLFGQGLRRVFWYAEAYHATQIAGADDTYTVLSYISEVNQPQPIDSLMTRQKYAANSPDVLVGSFDVRDLPSGSYYLWVSILNQDNEAVAERSRRFFVYNPDVQRDLIAAGEMTFEQSPFVRLDEQEAEEELGQIQFIATERERSRIGRVEDQDLEAQQRFLHTFWQKRDPESGTVINEARRSFKQRAQYATERFGTPDMKGWETDRGRVVLKYGQPSHREPNMYSREMRPHIIWEYYNIPGEGRSLFVFADRTGFGNFELIHSDVTGERSLPNWKQEIVR